MFLFSQLHFIELHVEISIPFGLQKNREGMWVVCDASESNKKFTKDVNNDSHAERRTSRRNFRYM